MFQLSHLHSHSHSAARVSLNGVNNARRIECHVLGMITKYEPRMCLRVLHDDEDERITSTVYAIEKNPHVDMKRRKGTSATSSQALVLIVNKVTGWRKESKGVQ
jgi:hypothetical protein